MDKEERSVVPETGEGSEYGRKRREEARKRRRGYRIRKIDPDDQPWVLSEKKKGGKQLSTHTHTQHVLTTHGCGRKHHVFDLIWCAYALYSLVWTLWF